MVDTEQTTRQASNGKCNGKQTDFCQRIVQEITWRSTQNCWQKKVRHRSRCWVLHSGPGTGKLYMVKMIREELFEHIAGWTRGSQYHIGMLQGVMATI